MPPRPEVPLLPPDEPLLPPSDELLLPLSDEPDEDSSLGEGAGAMLWPPLLLLPTVFLCRHGKELEMAPSVISREPCYLL